MNARVDDVLFLAHRIPYPPNKGDKLRAYRVLTHLAARHRIHLGTFVDDRDDFRHVQTLRETCASVCAEWLDPRLARIRSLRGLASREALSLPYYRNAALRRWVEQTVRDRRIDTAVVFSSVMAQYVIQMPQLRVLIDFVDVDSAKWTEYARARRWPLSWLYRREGRRLLDFERRAAERASRAFFVTDAEVALWRRLAPDCATRVDAVGNGVDTRYFSPDFACGSPFAAATLPIVFTGAMNYWPNVDAVRWFAEGILPRVRAARPTARFYIVGMSPAPAVTALASDAVHITGTVDDVRPYLRHAAAIVAPLRLARGIQNKVLEAMAMGRPVVASAACAAPIDAIPGRHLLTASDADEFAASLITLLGDPEQAAAIGRAARERIVSHYDWNAQLAPLCHAVGPAVREREIVEAP